MLRYFIFILLCWPAGIHAQSEGYKFLRFDTKNGLSHNQTNCFLKDRQGFIWVGTQIGLNRFDGYTFKVFKSRPGDSTTLANDYVYRLFEDPTGKIWISDNQNFTVYDPVTERFTRNADDCARQYGLPNAQLTKFLKSQNGEYWINHKQAGLCKFDIGQNKLIRITHSPLDTSTLSVAQIGDFQEDSNGFLWIVHVNGILECLDPGNLKVIYRNYALRDLYPGGLNNLQIFVDADNDAWIYSDDPKGGFFFDNHSRSFRFFNTGSQFLPLKNNNVRSITQDSDGNIWIATDHGGITLYNKASGKTVNLLHNPSDEKSISQNSAISLYSDPSGIIWIGTFKKGFNIYHKNAFRFPLYHIPALDANGCQADDINRFVEDNRGNIWIGTNGGGLVYFDRSTGRFTHYRNKPGDPNSLSNDVIVSLLIDHEQKLWIGTYFGGLDCFDGRRFTHYVHTAGNPNSLSDDRVWEIYEDSKYNLWVGTLRGGLNMFDRKQNIFRHYRPTDANSVHSDYISSILEDRRGNLWVGTEHGLDVLEPQTGVFKHLESNPARPGSLSNNSITSILEDSRGNIWVATLHGLNLYDRKTETFRTFGKAEGLPDAGLLSMLEDANQGLWMGTQNGLANFVVTHWQNDQPEKFFVRNYTEMDGLQAREFNENAACKTRRGELIFGGANGFNIIFPAAINQTPDSPRIVLTDFQIFNHSILPREDAGGRIILERSIAETQEITLDYRQNVFSIEFAALSFIHPEKNVYQYKLEGFDPEWFTADKNNRKITYTNLDPGKYTFQVRVASTGDIITGQRNLKIRILPPFWRTPLAYLLYLLAIAGALWLARWVLLDRERIKFRIAQERTEARRIHELDLLKIKFLTNISHEFRTPLSLILTPLERLLKASNGNGEASQLALIYRHAQNLLNLVNQLLDFKKLEVEETRFMPDQGDIVSFIKTISQSFYELSEKRGIRFSCKSSIPALYMVFDQEKLSRAMYNLLYNAFKFTQENGRVTVKLDLDKSATPDATPDMLEIRVIDTGIGIPKSAQSKIFDRFYQHRVPDSIVNQGSGIGLSITREFVQMHGGTIEVESEEGAGSVFLMRLPVRKVEVQRELQQVAPAEAVPAVPASSNPEQPAEIQPEPRRWKVLLVEDNEDFRGYLKDALQSNYDIMEAFNGLDALNLLRSNAPDLVVSDIMMPEMDGIELCRRIKGDRRLMHIPVILLTARAAEEMQLEGYETGADAYITKPFLMEILAVRIQNLLEQRKRSLRQPGSTIEIKPGDIAITSLDEQLVKRAMALVELNMANSEFSVEELSHELSMSRVYLYKKLLALTGKSPIEFIRVIRLKRAAQLLVKSQLTVAEVAYKVGFNNPKNFSRYFKAEFGMLPTAYQKKTAQPGTQLPVD